MRRSTVAGLLALALWSVAPARGAAAENGVEPPGAALVLPFDSTEGHVSFLAAQNTGAAQVSSHWTFWADVCSKLADADICLTSQDSVIIDPTTLASIGPDNQPTGGGAADLSGNRGFAVVTAFATDADCNPLRGSRSRIVDGALTGSWSIAELDKNSAFGTSAIVLHRSADGFVELPDQPLLDLDLYTWNPDTLTKSEIVLIGLRENAGERPGEVGPIGTGDSNFVHFGVSYVDTLEVAKSLAGGVVGCAAFDDVRRLVEGAGVQSSGFLRFSDFRPPVGGGTAGSRMFVFGLHGWAFEGFGQMQNGIYRFSEQ